MSIRYRCLLIVVSTLTLAAVPACFTALKHPRLASLNYARPDTGPCSNCHSNEQIWSFNHSALKPTYESYSRPWLLYYDTAWWYAKRWDYHPDILEERGDNENSTREDH